MRSPWSMNVHEYTTSAGNHLCTTPSLNPGRSESWVVMLSVGVILVGNLNFIRKTLVAKRWMYCCFGFFSGHRLVKVTVG